MRQERLTGAINQLLDYGVTIYDYTKQEATVIRHAAKLELDMECKMKKSLLDPKAYYLNRVDH